MRRAPKSTLTKKGKIVLAFLLACSIAALVAVTAGGGSSSAGKTTLPPGQAPKITEAALVSRTMGWVLTEDHLLRTDDAGKHWSKITPNGVMPGEVSGVFFLDPSTGWLSMGVKPDKLTGASPAETVFKTTDGGRHWSSAVFTLPGQATYDKDYADWTQAAIYFVDSRNGWISVPRFSNSTKNEGELYRTTDGGASWQHVTVPLGERPRFANASEGAVTGLVGDRLRLFLTTDGGSHWTQRNELSGAGTATLPVSTPRWFNATDGVYLVSLPLPGNPAPIVYFYQTHDGGKVWSASGSFPFKQNPQAVDFIDKDHWKAVLGSTFYFTDDGGAKWNPINAGRPIPAVSLSFPTPASGWAIVSDKGTCNHWRTRCTLSTLLATRNGGAAWSPLVPAPN